MKRVTIRLTAYEYKALLECASADRPDGARARPLAQVTVEAILRMAEDLRKKRG